MALAARSWRGGRILLAEDDEGEVVGCLALIAAGNAVWGLAKMAVDPDLRRNGIGRRLLLAARDWAEREGASALFLGSNERLADAVHLYESVGFRRVPRRRVGELPYARANVFMRLVL